MDAIATLTMNPALDINAATDRVIPGEKLRCTAPRYDLAARAEKIAAHLLDRQPQMRDQRVGVRRLGARSRKFRVPRAEHRLQRLDDVGQRIGGAHRRQSNHKSRSLQAPIVWRPTNGAINPQLPAAMYIAARANRSPREDSRAARN